MTCNCAYAGLRLRALRHTSEAHRLQVQAWEFDVPLRVVALRGSVPGAWPADFKAAAGRHAKLAFEQRAQLADIYDELTGGRQAGRQGVGAAWC